MRSFFVVSVFALVQVLYAETIAFLSLDANNRWQPVVCNDGACRFIHTDLDVQTFDYDVKSERIVYVAADRSVRLKSKGSEKVLLRARKDAYTQPRFVDKDRVAVVKLLDGSSKKTQIVTFNLDHPRSQNPLVAQYATTLDPWIDKKRVLYAKVTCADGCGKIIQEIWQSDRYGFAKQLTLENRLAHHPSYDSHRNTLYYSAKESDGYAIYRLDMYRSVCKGERIAYEPEAADLWPMPDGEGGIFFVRSKKGKERLLHLRNGKLKEVEMTKRFSRIRELKVYP